MPSREAIAIPFVSNAGTVFLEILLHRVLFLLGAKATNTFLPRNTGHTFDSRGQSWHIHHSPRNPISPGSAERQSRSISTNDTSLPSPPRANNVGGSAALHAAASWGASEVALPERSPAAAACNLLRPQTSTAFKDSQPRPVARVVALPPLLSPLPPLAQSSVLISTTLLWRGTGVQQNFCPPHQKHRFPLVPPPPPQHLPPPDSSRRAALTAIQSRTLSLCLCRCAEQTRETPNKAGPISATTTTTPVSSLCSASAHAHGRDSSVPGLLSSFAATPSGLGPPNWSPRPPPSFCDSECDGICRFTLGV